LIFFAPILIPRAISLYRGLRVQIAHRRPPRAIPSEASRALNVLFGAIVLFLTLSLPFSPYAPAPNVFSQTGSRLTTPTDVIFARVARHRPDSALTDYDKLLRSKLTSTASKKVYLRFGPDALLSCRFCLPDDIRSYLLYYLPWNVLVPHLLHLLILGIVTATPFAGSEAGRWRNWFTLGGMVLALIDLYVMSTFDPVASASSAVRAGQIPPSSLFHTMSLLRPLAFTVFDSISAVLIYLSATHRFFATPPSQAEQVDQVMAAATTALANATNKLHGVSVTRNAVVRDKALKAQDDVYWRTVVAMEGSPEQTSNGSGGSIWEEEEVVRAMSRAMNGQSRSRGVDMAQLGVSAGEYVDGITAGLENTTDGHPV
jgi:hypothetical protein